jgi:hypothetical protein
MSNKELFQKAKDLQLPIGQYALFGSTPLGVRNLRDCHDVDIIVTEDLWNKFKNENWEIITVNDGVQKLSKDDIEILKNWYPGEWDIKKLIEEAEIIDELPFVKLKEVLKWKKLFNREKDQKDIKIIEEFLKTT